MRTGAQYPCPHRASFDSGAGRLRCTGGSHRNGTRFLSRKGERQSTLSLLFLIIGVSPLLAPTIGSALVSALSWRWIFILLGANAFMVLTLRQADFPVELDLRATLSHTLRETGGLQPRVEDLHERVRKPRAGTHYLFVIDSSGSHAARQRMRLVKGVISSLLTRSFKREDEVAMIVFSGTSAQVVLEPTQVLPDALAALEYLPTGGRTPLAAALDQARGYLTPATPLILLTDGRANIRCMEETPGRKLLMWRS
ncbi:MAG TPA: VWA domain-containing protein [Edaphobacter sp.]|nr:VWA domain-containing protein [Edaphobacter sp.]